MPKPIDQDTRYYIDLDVKARTILGWGYGQRDKLVQKLPAASHRRIFVTRGQYHKLEDTGHTAPGR